MATGGRPETTPASAAAREVGARNEIHTYVEDTRCHTVSRVKGQSTADEQAESDLLDREWDPIGVYDGPPAEQGLPGEYATYAPGILETLRSGGGKSDVMGQMRTARQRMSLEDITWLDERAAEVMVRWWNIRRTS
jgi:hypothetical protein